MSCKLANLQTEENARLIRDAFQRGLDSQEIAALHGTSLFVLKEILRTGFQPGANYPRGLLLKGVKVREGDVFVYPINGRIPERYENAYDFDYALKSAKVYAEISAEVHDLSERLGLDISSAENETTKILTRIFTYNPEKSLPGKDPDREPAMRALEILVKRGINKDILEKAVVESRKKKGLVIGYSRGIFDEGEPLPGDDDKDVRVRNVRIGDIIGIEPLDQETYDFLEGLGSA